MPRARSPTHALRSHAPTRPWPKGHRSITRRSAHPRLPPWAADVTTPATRFVPGEFALEEGDLFMISTITPTRPPAGPASATAIRTDTLPGPYGRRAAVDRLSFEVPVGVVAGFVGLNGAG